MAQQARVLVSAVGPYSTHGHSVVDACVDAGCDYLDVSGEPLFIETVERRLHETARRKGSLVVSAAGFDSVPADMGAQLLADAFVASGWALGSIESFLSVQGPVHGHFATYASAVQGVGAAGDLRRLRRQVARPRLPLLGAPPPRLQRPSWDPSLGAYVASFPGSDASVVKRTLAFNAAHGRPVFHFAANFLMHRVSERVRSLISLRHTPLRPGQALAVTAQSLFAQRGGTVERLPTRSPYARRR